MMMMQMQRMKLVVPNMMVVAVVVGVVVVVVVVGRVVVVVGFGRVVVVVVVVGFGRVVGVGMGVGRGADLACGPHCCSILVLMVTLLPAMMFCRATVLLHRVILQSPDSLDTLSNQT